MAKRAEPTSSLESEMAAINAAFGAGTILKMGDPTFHGDLDVVPTGVLPLDIALDCGGYPKGRIIEIFGTESSGKTTLALTAIPQFQATGKVAYIDVEHALDPEYSRALGITVTEMIISQPTTAEQVLTIALRLSGVPEVGLIVVDSVASMTPRAELEGEVGDAHIAQLARLMSQNLRKLQSSLYNANTTAIFINQNRTKPGVVYGSPKYQPGGNALKFYSSIRLETVRGSKKKDKTEVFTHNEGRVKIHKNKCGRPFRECEFDLVFGKGIPRANCALDIGIDSGILGKSGNWFVYTGEQLGNGRANAAAFLEEHPDTLDEIEGRVRDYYFSGEQTEGS